MFNMPLWVYWFVQRALKPHFINEAYLTQLETTYSALLKKDPEVSNKRYGKWFIEEIANCKELLQLQNNLRFRGLSETTKTVYDLLGRLPQPKTAYQAQLLDRIRAMLMLELKNKGD